MNKDKTKKIAKETAKALGVTGASAAIGAVVLDPKKPWYRLANSFPYDSPFRQYMFDYGDGGLYVEIAKNPNIGVGLNAAASGLGGLAAYGLIKGSIKGLKKLDDNRLQKKAALFANIKVNNS